MKKLTKEERDEAERKRRRQIYFILKMKEQDQDRKPRSTTLNQEHNLWAIREARREARNG